MRREIDDRELLRLVAGELSPDRAAELERHVEDDAGLASRYRSLKETWTGLELPDPEPAPADFRVRTASAVRAAMSATGDRDASAWPANLAPWPARALAGLALAMGVALGVVVGSALESPETPIETGGMLQADGDALVEWYWTVFEEVPPEEGDTDEPSSEEVLR